MKSARTLLLFQTLIRAVGLAASIGVAYFCLLPVAQGRSAISGLGHQWANHGPSYGLALMSVCALILALWGLVWRRPRLALFSFYAALPFSSVVGLIHIHHLGFL